MVSQLADAPRGAPEPKRRPGRPPKPKPLVKRPRRAHGTGSIVVGKGGRVYALDVRDAAGHRKPYEAVGADVEARYRDAEAWLDRQIAARKRLAGQVPVTVREHLALYLYERYRQAPASTLATYRAHVARCKAILGTLVTAVTEEDVNGLTAAMLDDGYSARYCRAVRTTLRAAFARLVPKLLDRNPVGEYPGQMTVPKRRPNVLDEADAAEFERQALTTRWGMMWVLAIRYGLRRGELRALQWSDLDRRGCRLDVRHGMRAGRRLGDTKNHQERSIKLAPSIVAALEAFAGSAWSSPTWMFARRDGQPMTAQEFAEEFAAIVAVVDERRYRAALEAGRPEALARQTGLPRLTPHGLRHTAATLFLRGSAARRPVSVAKVSQILGHANPAITHRMYSWAVPSDDDVLDAAVEALVTPLPITGGDSAGWPQTGSE